MEQKRQRGFEVVSAYADKDIQLPKRATHQAAGYDIEAAETIVLPSFWKEVYRKVATDLKQWIFSSPTDKNIEAQTSVLKPVLVPTGIKSYMLDDEYLKIVNRSSNPLKRFLVLPNGIGIIDADYYNNEANEGHIYVQLLNFGLTDQTIQKGERIAQGIFTKFLKADDDNGGMTQRQGGFGSSN